MMTINAFNRLIGKTTLHPLVCIADLSADRLDSDICKTCNFYALLYNNARLRLIIPGEKFLIPSGKISKNQDIQVFFSTLISYATLHSKMKLPLIPTVVIVKKNYAKGTRRQYTNVSVL